MNEAQFDNIEAAMGQAGSSSKKKAQQQAAAPFDAASVYGLTGHTARCAGALLGKMCGDVLGASVEGWSPEDILLRYKDGLTLYQPTTRG